MADWLAIGIQWLLLMPESLTETGRECEIKLHRRLALRLNRA